MLNCTDLACVLHHHHFYAHLHYLKHHLQDDIDHTALGEGSDVDHNNIEDSELSSLSHLDAPNDVIYMVCGVVIAMLMVGLVIILVAVTISKLRKREESAMTAGNVESSQVVVPTTTTTASDLQQQFQQQQLQHQQQTPVAFRQNPNSVWVFPPLPPQPNLFSVNSQDALIHVNERNGLKGFKKQLSGRFRRLVTRKPNEPAPAIPPELKSQLKTIYVY